jgi:formate dehydrogenase major subunit
MGALPNRLPGFQDILDPAVRARFERHWNVPLSPRYGLNLTQMLHAIEERKLTALYVIGENPAQSDADSHRVQDALAGLDHLVVQEIVMTRTAELAHVVLPATASWCESEGTVTNSERRVQRVRKAVEPPSGAKDELWILAELARRMGVDLGHPTAEALWNEFRVVAPHFAGGMSYARLEEHGGLQWPCPDETHPGTPFLHGRLWDEPRGGKAAAFWIVTWEGPSERADAEFPLLLTTGRRLESYNTGVQTVGCDSPLRREESLELSPEDAARFGIADGELVDVRSRRGVVTVPARIDASLRPGLVFMTFHFPEQANTNLLTIDASDPKSGTAEFKACAVRVEPAARRAAER